MTQEPSNSVSKAIAASITSFVLNLDMKTVDRTVLEGSIQALITVALERDLVALPDAEIRAAAEKMLEPQSAPHEHNGVRTYKTLDELDEIGRQEVYYHAATIIHAAEKVRFA